jgi:ribosomal protein S18 acetylase RimI-like enzyme
MVTWRETSAESDAAVAMLTEYFGSRDLTFPSGPGSYTTKFPVASDFEPPRGVFLIVEGDNLEGEPADVGCGGIRSVDPGEDGAVRFEVKHLWLESHTRGSGYGRLLIEELERRAIAFGADELVLDTNDSLEAAAGLYRSTGFETIRAYNDNPNATTWYRKRL